VGPSASGTPLTYFQVVSALSNATAGFEGQTWVPISVVGIAVVSPEIVPVSNVTGGSCPVTWVGAPASDLYLAATSPAAPPGTSNAYFALLRGSEANGPVLYAGVANGTASLLFTTGSIPQCPGYRSLPVPLDVLDSPQAVTLANASGISLAFPTSIAPIREWEISAQPPGFYGSPQWEVIDANACGGAYVVVVDAFDGATEVSENFLGPPPGACSFQVTFQETGLAPGTEWYASLTSVYSDSFLNSTSYSSGSTITFEATNGTHRYYVTTPGYSGSPSVGQVVVNGRNVVVTTAFVPISGYYSVSFNESGLPPGTLWGVYVPEWGASGVAGTGPEISFAVPNGTWSFSIVDLPTGYSATPASGNVTVGGVTVTEYISFVRYSSWVVTFTESGLPAGVGWSWAVDLEDSSFAEGQSTNSTIQLEVPNGTYLFFTSALLPGTFNGAPTFQASPANGTLVVDGSNVSISISYTVRAGWFPVVFNGTGLPPGATYFLQVSYPEGTSDGRTVIGSFWGLSGPLGTATVYAENGTVSYAIEAGYGLVSSPGSGGVTVNGSGVSISLAFASVVLYQVTFEEHGLTSGNLWIVTLDGLESDSVDATVVFFVPNGTFEFYVLGPVDAVPTPRNGTIDLEGAATTETVGFELPQSIAFEETGLPTKTLAKDGWTVVVNGTMGHARTRWINFTEYNGTYGVFVSGPSGYRATGIGSVSVEGPTSVAVTMTKERSYTLTFTERGLPTKPAAQSWCVEVNTYEQCGAAARGIVYTNLTPGNYSYGVLAPLSGQNVTAKVGKTVVSTSGSLALTKSTTVALTFAYRFAVTFTEVGAPGGIWAVTIKGRTLSNATGGPITFYLVNGTYGYRIGAEPGYRSHGLPSKVLVSGGPASATVTFTKK
jgi:hypothetical protein